MILLLTVAVIWVGASALTQYLFARLHAGLPITLTYVNVAEFALLLPLAALRERYTLVRSDWRGAARAAAIVGPVWFAAQCTYNASLSGTSVSSSTMLSSTSCAFTLALSLLVPGGRPPAAQLWARARGVLLVLIGAALVSFSDAEGATASTAWGDALALLSAALYAVYTLLIAHVVPPGASMLVFFGYVGLVCAVTMAPGMGGVLASGREDAWPLLSWPPGLLAPPLLLVLSKGLIDNVLSDLLWARAVRLTSASLGTVALSLTIPLAMASDALFDGQAPTAASGVGAACIAAGFVAAVLAETHGPG
jgi:solute carrier family 35 protein F5